MESETINIDCISWSGWRVDWYLLGICKPSTGGVFPGLTGNDSMLDIKSVAGFLVSNMLGRGS